MCARARDCVHGATYTRGAWTHITYTHLSLSLSLSHTHTHTHTYTHTYTLTHTARARVCTHTNHTHTRTHARPHIHCRPTYLYLLTQELDGGGRRGTNCKVRGLLIQFPTLHPGGCKVRFYGLPARCPTTQRTSFDFGEHPVLCCCALATVTYDEISGLQSDRISFPDALKKRDRGEILCHTEAVSLFTTVVR